MVMTKRDIAFTTSRLVRFMTNPGPGYQATADLVLLYLQHTRALALQYSGEDELLVASDASYIRSKKLAGIHDEAIRRSDWLEGE